MANKKVLLISPALKSMMVIGRPHLGIGLIAGKLTAAGFDVRILDYIIDRKLPPVGEVIDSFKPDITGITINTAYWSLADRMLDELDEYPELIKLTGGPHSSLYSDELTKDGRIHYVFRGESEEGIVDICERGIIPDSPVVVEPPLPDMSRIPLPAFDLCMSREKIIEYPLQTSRGCPFNCIFCEVSGISSKKWRPRPIGQVIGELETVKQKYPGVRIIQIQDDNAAHDMDRFKEFLGAYNSMRGGWILRIDNIRADNVDAEIVTLLEKAGCESICLGVEHANPEIFKSIKKGETLDRIRESARLIKNSGMRLGMCFVIGLPGDSYEKTKESVKFAKENGADFMFWNILVPHKGTQVREWFEKNGRLRDERSFISAMDDQIMACRPVAETDSFPASEILKSHFMAVLSTNNYKLTKKNFLTIIFKAFQYGLIKELFRSLPSKLTEKLKAKMRP